MSDGGTQHPNSVTSNNHAVTARRYADIAERDADTAFSGDPVSVDKEVVIASPPSYFTLHSTTSGLFTIVADNSIVLQTINSVTDSGGIARFNHSLTDPVVGQTVVISNFITNPDYNTTGRVTVVGTGFFELANIVFGSDETGSFLSNGITITSTAHGIVDDREVVLKTVDATTYDGTFLIYRATANTFDVSFIFAGTAVGNWFAPLWIPSGAEGIALPIGVLTRNVILRGEGGVTLSSADSTLGNGSISTNDEGDILFITPESNRLAALILRDSSSVNRLRIAYDDLNNEVEIVSLLNRIMLETALDPVLILHEGSSDTEVILTLTSTGSNSTSIDLFITNRTPVGNITGGSGSVAFRGGADPGLFLHTDSATNNTGWKQFAFPEIASFSSTLSGIHSIVTIDSAVTLQWDADNWLLKIVAPDIGAETLNYTLVIERVGENGDIIASPVTVNANGEVELASLGTNFLTDTGSVNTTLDLTDPNQEQRIYLSYYGTNSTIAAKSVDLLVTSRGNTQAGGVDIICDIRDSTLPETNTLLYYLRFANEFLVSPVLSSPMEGLSSATLISESAMALPTLSNPDGTGGNNAIVLLASDDQVVEFDDTTKEVFDDTTFDMYVKWPDFSTSFGRIFEFSSGVDGLDFVVVLHEGGTPRFIYVTRTGGGGNDTSIRLDGYWAVAEWVRVTINHFSNGDVHIYKNKILVLDENGITAAGTGLGITLVENLQGVPLPNAPRPFKCIANSSFVSDPEPNLEINNFKVFNSIVVP